MNLTDENIIEITDELSTEYEISKVLREYPKDTVIVKNVKGYDMPVVTGICNTRDKIAKSINCEVSEITEKIIDAMENPLEVTKFTDFSDYDNLIHYLLLLHPEYDYSDEEKYNIFKKRYLEDSNPNNLYYPFLIEGSDYIFMDEILFREKNSHRV